MSGTAFLINLVGAVALLLWGMRMVSTGVSRAFGSGLREAIARSVSNRFKAVFIGVGVTGLLQSSTATALLVSSFAGKGLIATGPALAIMLGADVGTTLVAQVLSFDVSWLSPAVIIVGVITHFSSAQAFTKQIGRIGIGLGIMLLALKLIVSASEPMRESEVLQFVFSAMEDELVVALLLTALLTWLAHSSLAVVLLIMSLASGDVIPMSLALVMVIGANFGGVLAPIVANWAKGPEARRVPIGNAAFKFAGCVLLLPFVDALIPVLALVEDDPARQVVNFHTFFNLCIAGTFIIFTDTFAKFLDRAFPELPLGDDQGVPQYLDRSSIDNPTVALACAERETVRMGNVVEAMLRESFLALKKDDLKLATNVIKMDNAVDSLHEAIKLYVTEASRESLSNDESQRVTNVLTFTTDLEHIGDIIENLMEMVAKKIRKKMRFSDDGLKELIEIHERVANNLKLALGTFMSGDVNLAKQLLAEKATINLLEREGTESHMARLREGRLESIETSALHMDILRDLKRIHSHIVAISYPILDAAGYLKHKKSADDSTSSEPS